ncbi:unnamed protein product [Clonostachys rosea f. rosea IK726]|uniref:quinol--cytochrome-c reductase n=2 Tax=Bionectria ochroleuca TaxID=29856 RepID=A0A0B7JM79_BIOOC|nr:unnamed protein product [Clonostachys rosea f. rosea IK726]
MAPLTNATRVCLRASKATAVRAAALSTTAATRGDSAASYTQYSSPFKQGGSKGSKIPDFGKYVSKNAGDSNKLVSYFMVGAMGAITAAGAKSTVQEFLVNMSASADVLAMAKVEVDMNNIPEGKNVIIKWRGKPIFIRHRTQEEINEANKVNVASLRDPETDDQRVKNPEWLVMLGMSFPVSLIGPAPLNLEVPPYDFPEEGKLVIG